MKRDRLSVRLISFRIRTGNTILSGVDPSQQGQGTAGMLVQAAADYIRSTGRKTGASCSYASAWLKRHKEYGDIYEP